MITQDVLKHKLIHDNVTGDFFWKMDVAHNVKKGDKAGCKKGNYINIMINRESYLAHRLVWIYYNGEEPNIIDHINGDASDNRIENLQNVTQAVNRKNCSLYNTSTSGSTGVTFQVKSNKWRAYIYHNYRNIHLGLFSTKEEAIHARQQANIKYKFSNLHDRVASFN